MERLRALRRHLRCTGAGAGAGPSQRAAAGAGAGASEGELALAPTDAEWVTYTKVPRLEPGSAEALEYLDREGYW